jgi:hypothetical protein
MICAYLLAFSGFTKTTIVTQSGLEMHGMIGTGTFCHPSMIECAVFLSPLPALRPVGRGPILCGNIILEKKSKKNTLQSGKSAAKTPESDHL